MSAVPSTVPAGRVAIIAVHGIADQRRGDTGMSVALQLAAVSGGTVQSRDMPLPVPPLDPAVPQQPNVAGGPPGPGWESLRQSWRSDFLDASFGGLPSAPARRAGAAPEARTPETAEPEQADTGVRFTDYLLAKAHGARTSNAPEAANVSVTAVRGPQLQADVYEMHWADLSRLPGSVARIVAELFTLVFHLSRLGVDALSLAEKLAGPSELTWLARVQRSADWLFSRLLALLALQLVMFTLVLAPALLATSHPGGTRLLATALAGVGSAAALVYLRHWRWRAAIPVGIVVGVGAWALVGGAYGTLAVMLAWLVVLSAVYLSFLRYCEQRFRAVLGIGIVLYAVTLGCIALFGHSEGFTGKAGWIKGTLGALEAILFAHAILWPALAGLLVLSVLLSERALRRGKAAGRDHRQMLVTARLGLFTSVGAFLVCLMIGFMLASWALKSMVGCELYEPWWFREKAAALCASDFLGLRADANAASFSLVALLLLGLLGFVTIVFAPSILRELRLGPLHLSAALGRWLSAGYCSIERLVRVWGGVVAVGALLVALALLFAQLMRSGWVVDLPTLGRLIEKGENIVRDQSKDWLGSLVIGVAGGAVGLLALGKVAIKQLQALRSPLDAALDVDNHFREFPRDAICRVRIIERYVALLDHVRGRGYQRVVIVAHSQGTVITADLLRYLQQRDRLAGNASAPRGQVDLRALRVWLDSIELRLLTVGSPLRQLYALRFPDLYPWVMSAITHDDDGAQWTGPLPRELGVCRWSNLWGSGDYVGRWLWALPDGSHPAPLQMDPARYNGAEHEGQDTDGRRWKDRCIGADAHTHYFELDQQLVAEELLALTKT